MAEEYIYQRERDMLDYFRNNLTDPSSRGTGTVDNFVATAGQTAFVLTNTLVKNVSETITVDGVSKKKGYDFTISYGKGSATTTVTLLTGATLDDAVVIGYTYGSSMVEREFSRSDATLPRAILMFLTGSEEPAALADGIEGGKGSYFNASYRIEIRAKYADQAREIASAAFNLGRKMRHAVLFRTNGTQSTDLQNFDFDPDKDCYVWQFTVNVQWEILFE